MGSQMATSILPWPSDEDGLAPVSDLPMADIAPPPIWDDSEFVVRRNVPVLDAHRHLDKGTVDRGLLELIAKNSNARSANGDLALILIGHTDPGLPETQQPPIVGYVSGFTVGQYLERPCLLADFHIKKDKFDLAMTFPHRSIERAFGKLPQSNFIDAVSLLRYRPERALGLLTYSRTLQNPREEIPVATFASMYASLDAVQADQRALKLDNASLRLRYNRDDRRPQLQALVAQGYKLDVPRELARVEAMPEAAYQAHLVQIRENYRRSATSANPATGWSPAGARDHMAASKMAADRAMGIMRYARSHKIGKDDFSDAVTGYDAEMAKKRPR